MSTEACDRCGDPAPEPLLRSIELRVDGDRVDDQTLCPDCFSQWISRYQDEMANDMPQPESEEPDAGDDITIAEETEPTPDLGTGSNVLDSAVADAGNRAESGAQANARGQSSDLASHPTDGGGDDIREVGGEPPQGPGTGDGVEIDLDAESDHGDDEDDDDGGLF
jgi:hypothetical protein